MSRDDWLSAAIVDSCGVASSIGLEIPERPLDILAQQIVAAVAAEEWGENDLRDDSTCLSLSQSGARTV